MTTWQVLGLLLFVALLGGLILLGALVARRLKL